MSTCRTRRGATRDHYAIAVDGLKGWVHKNQDHIPVVWPVQLVIGAAR
jgi:hypothetical protein